MKTTKTISVFTERDLKIGSVKTVLSQIVGSTKFKNAEYKVSTKTDINAREYRYTMTRVD